VSAVIRAEGAALAAEDLASPMAARAYYSQATDDAYELRDSSGAALARARFADLAMMERQPIAARQHLCAVTDHSAIT
jgi:hypothetical protein